MKNRNIMFTTILLLPVFLALSPSARALCQDGCGSNDDTFLGDDALLNDTGFGQNTAIGRQALTSNTSGENNTAVGAATLESNTTGFGNVAIGAYSLFLNNTGSYNTAIMGMESNTIGSNNTAVGFNALDNNTTGNNNTATGVGALEGPFSPGSTGSSNTADGYQALYSYTTGSNNTAVGYQALFSNTTGIDNTAIGYNALLNATGSNNIGLGLLAGSSLTTGSNNIDIGNKGVAGDSNTIRIGTKARTETTTYTPGISGVTVAGGVGVIIDTNGHLGTVTSSERFKDEVKPMDKASEVILALKPVTFRYKHHLDPAGIPQFGLVAEEVEKVNPDLVARDAEGKIYAVRYEAVNAMLLNEFLKEHRKVEEQQVCITELNSRVAKQEKIIAQQQKGTEALTAQLKEQAAQIQKISARIEISKRAPKVVVNTP